MKALIYYQQFFSANKSIELTTEEASLFEEGYLTDQQKAEIIYAHLTEVERKQLPGGVDGLERALDVDYAGIVIEKTQS